MADRADRPLRLSILDHSPVSSGSTLGDAFWHSTALAQLAERSGYERYWVAEHHNMPWLASSSPPVLVAHVAATTTTLRVGAGGVMLPNHTPLSVAEQFGMLEELHPGRIDLGLGRASGSDEVTAQALRHSTAEFIDLFSELLGFFQGSFPPNHPYTTVTAVPGRDAMPALWLLGSGTHSAQLAGHLGLPFGHGGHFSPGNNQAAIATYRAAFRPSDTLSTPYSLLSVGVICADTDQAAHTIHNAAYQSTVRSLSGNPGPLQSPEELAATPPGPRSPLQERFVSEIFASHIVGSPSTVHAGLQALASRTGADEIMIATIMHGYTDRLHSYHLIGRECLTGRGLAA